MNVEPLLSSDPPAELRPPASTDSEEEEDYVNQDYLNEDYVNEPVGLPLCDVTYLTSDL